MDIRRVREQRRDGAVKVEGKLFQLSWRNEGRKDDEVGIKELTRKGAFSVSFTLEGGRWLSKLLSQIAVGKTVIGASFKRAEPLGYLMGTLKENRRGKFFQVTVFRRNTSWKFATIRIPSGIDLKGWQSVGVELMKIIEPINSQGKTEATVSGLGTKFQSFADVCRGSSTRQAGELPVVITRSEKLGMINSWWNPVVICKTNCSEPDWEWLRCKINGVFPQANIKVVKKDEALIAMFSEDEARRLIDMPTLVNWEGSFHFHKWNYEAGSLTEDDLRILFKEVKINFYGIPYHLRDRATVEDLAKLCGKRWVIDEDSIRHDRDQCSISLISPEFDKIPRIIILSMQGKKTPVVVEVVGCVPKPMPEHVTVLPTQKGDPHISSLTSNPRMTVCGGLSNLVAESNMQKSFSAPPGFEQERRYEEE
ncbi:hypothetical protein FRX31_019301, partial [Thalictrum thalictroides]